MFVSSDNGILFLVFEKQTEVTTPILIAQVEIKEHTVLQRGYNLSRQKSITAKTK